MKTTISALILIFTLSSGLFARTWTDKDGRSIDADIVKADETEVTINKAGKEFKLPLEKLSDADTGVVKEWLAEQKVKKEEVKKEEVPVAVPPVEVTINKAGKLEELGNADKGDVREWLAEQKRKKAVPPGQASFDGKPLALGGKTNLFEYEYSAEQLAMVKKEKGTDTGFKIAFALPANFDPTKPHKVFIVGTAENNAKQAADGNVGMMSFFGKQCAASGWICMAYDSNLGRVRHDVDLQAALAKINKEWPGFKGWEFAAGGFSGGAKACMFPMAYLIKNEYKVIGGFLAGCNEDLSGTVQKLYRVPKSEFKDVKIFLGNPASKADYAEPVKTSMKRNGIANVRAEVHNGNSSLEYTQFAEGLKWIAGQ
jgi:hypothetical protein